MPLSTFHREDMLLSGEGTWPGHFDFCADNPKRVQIAWDAPSLALKIYTAKDPAVLVRAHATDAARRSYLRNGCTLVGVGGTNTPSGLHIMTGRR